VDRLGKILRSWPCRRLQSFRKSPLQVARRSRENATTLCTLVLRWLLRHLHSLLLRLMRSVHALVLLRGVESRLLRHHAFGGPMIHA
jgi:hypothetical protein